MSYTVSILSWNYQGKTNKYKLGALRQLVTENNIDIVVLQEASGIKISSILSTTHSEVSYVKGKASAGVRVFLKHSTFVCTPAQLGYYNKYALINLIRINSSISFNLIAVHLYSKVGRTERKQMWENLDFIEKINDWENSTGTDKSIMIGDLNHNPYDSNMLDPNVVNSRDSRNVILHQQKFEPVGSKDLYWYNPMWNMLGDHDHYSNVQCVPGTYYYNKEDETPIWNMLDGFILRPSLMNNIDFAASKVITGTSSHTFVKAFITGKNDSFIHEYYSDHLPIKLTVKIN